MSQARHDDTAAILRDAIYSPERRDHSLARAALSIAERLNDLKVYPTTRPRLGSREHSSPPAPNRNVALRALVDRNRSADTATGLPPGQPIRDVPRSRDLELELDAGGILEDPARRGWHYILEGSVA